MKCVVPLAGPDFVHPRFGVRPLIEVEGEPLLQKALNSRAWRGDLRGEDYVFVLRDVPEAQIVRDFIANHWPGARVVLLADLTGGAMFSAAAGVVQIGHLDEPVCVDLVDILFEGGGPGVWPADLGGLVPHFPSDEAHYSYLRMNGDDVLETAEKRVISSHASAGVYFFANPALYFAAMAHSITHREALSFKGALFLCPMMNGVVAARRKVRGVAVDNVRPISKMFHA